MGNLILIIAIILEIVFTGYRIKTRNNQTKTGSLLRVAEFVVFLTLTVTTIIEWSFRWYSLALLLFILAVNSGIRLLTGKFGNKPYKTGRTLFRAVSMVMLFIFSTVPALVFPQFKLPEMTGDYKIATAVYTYTDTTRNETFTDTGEHRKVNVEFWYPSDAQGTYPLVVFSHGAFGIKASNTSTYSELASNGYVVCSIDHPYHAAGTVGTDGNLIIGSTAFMQEVVDVNGEVYSEEEKLQLYDKWMTVRTGDISFVIDTILENTKNSNEQIFTLIDTGKIGLMGHSLGGAASVQLGRDRKDIGAVIDIDGTMLGEHRGIVDGEVVLNDEPYPLPLLNFYSEYVIDELVKNPDYVYPNKYIASISSEAFEVCIKGSNHMSYTDLPLVSPMLADMLSGISGGNTTATVDKYYCIETMNRLILEFFNSYLKGEGSFAVEQNY
jgi:dienelactone hydrolase